MFYLRKVCAARFSVVRRYEHSNKTVVTGCTAMPNPNSPFCSEHVEEEMPVLLSSKVTQATRNKLWDIKKRSQAYGAKLPNSSVFTVQTVLNV